MTAAFVANTNLLELSGLYSVVDAAYINDASVSVTVKDRAGANVGGQTWPINLVYVGSSDGDYRAVLVDGIEFAARQPYTAFIECDAGTNRIGHWEFKFTPEIRIE